MHVTSVWRRLQVQLLTELVRQGEVAHSEVSTVYKLLVDDAPAIRHAAAELVAQLLEELGQAHLSQVLHLRI